MERSRLLLNVERFFARRADAVTTVSAALARKLATNFGIPQPATILNVPYYIPPEKLPPRAWHKRFENVKVALYQGKFTARRRLDQVIRAGHFLDDGIVIVLRGLGPYLDTMRQLVAAEKLEDRVFILDPVPMNEMIAEASGADIGILAEDPQFQGEVASPNKLFEYIMAGMPVISANITAVHDVMDGLGICEYYRPEDGEDLARVINALCKDEARLNEMKANCRKNAFQLSWDNEGRKLVDIYEALLKS
jgi:glycosyltransferase involved in cell wall biosynthesis